MANLENSHPDMFNHYAKPGFYYFLIRATVYSNIARILRDQVIEMAINCASKGTGGLSGKKENADAASERWMRIRHLMAALREKLD